MDILPTSITIGLVVPVSVFFGLLMKRQLAQKEFIRWQKLPEEQRQANISECIFLFRKYEAYFTVFCIVAIFSAPVLTIVSKIEASDLFISLAIVIGIMMVSSFEASLREKKLRGATASGFEYGKEVVLGFVLCMTGQVAIWFSFWMIGKIEGIVVESLAWEPLFPTVHSYVMIFIKVVAGFFLFFLFYPFLLKICLRLEDADDKEMVSIIRASVEKTSFRNPKIWYLDYDKFKFFNAMVWINPFFGRRGRPVIIISRAIWLNFNRDELEAIICHELSHLELNHIRKRIMAVLFTLAVLICVGLSLKILLLFAPVIWFFLIIFSKILGIVAPLLVVSRVVRVQELQADAYAVFHLGAKPESMKSALEKLYEMNHMVKNKRDPLSYFSPASAHPTLEFRQKSLEAMQDRLSSGASFFQWSDYLTGDFRPLSKLQKLASFGSLGLAILLLFGTTVYSSKLDSGNWINTASEERQEVDYGMSGAPDVARDWIAALEANDEAAIFQLIQDKSGREIFNDSVWGKLVFFTAVDSNPENLEKILKEVDVPLENIEHAIPRARAQKNKQAYDRLVVHKKIRETGARSPANIDHTRL